jgi:hypothetical protein
VSHTQCCLHQPPHCHPAACNVQMLTLVLATLCACPTWLHDGMPALDGCSSWDPTPPPPAHCTQDAMCWVMQPRPEPPAAATSRPGGATSSGCVAARPPQQHHIPYIARLHTTHKLHRHKDTVLAMSILLPAAVIPSCAFIHATNQPLQAQASLHIQRRHPPERAADLAGRDS